VLLLRSVRYKFVYAGLGVLALVAAVPFLPQKYVARMDTITEYQGDESASTGSRCGSGRSATPPSTRSAAGSTPTSATASPTRRAKVTGAANNATIETQQVTDKARAYHSSYFEMLGEQGWPGLILWLVAAGTRGVADGAHSLAFRAKKDEARADGKASWQWGLATALQQSQITYLVGAAFVGIAYQPFIFMLIGLQCALWSYVRRTEDAPKKAHFRRPPAGARFRRAPEPLLPAVAA
jgi:hypothetical protein